MKRYLVVKYTGSNSISRINEINIIDSEFSDNIKELIIKYNLEVITNELSFMIERDGFGYYLINTRIFNNHFYNLLQDLINMTKRDYKLKTLLND